MSHGFVEYCKGYHSYLENELSGLCVAKVCGNEKRVGTSMLYIVRPAPVPFFNRLNMEFWSLSNGKILVILFFCESMHLNGFKVP
jgi:hypothetical protein